MIPRLVGTRRRRHDSTPDSTITRRARSPTRSSCSPARRRRQAAGRRAQPAADDEAALRAAGPPDRPRQDRRACAASAGRQRDPHRRDDDRERADLARRCWQTRCRCWSRARGWIADPQVRYKGTIGGDISHGDPGNDHPALMLALGCVVRAEGPGGERVVKADGFFLGIYSTLLEPSEILTADPHSDPRAPAPAGPTASSSARPATSPPPPPPCCCR